ncbi:MAG: putative Ig domain-containing protein [Gaiellaceae bacterium]
MRRVATAIALLCVLVAPAGAATHRIAAISITPALLPSATTGTAYNQALAGNGGTGPYTFAVTAGALPPGIALSGAGVLSGTPTSSGSFSFTVTATDSLAASGSQAFSLSVSPAAISISPTSLSPASRSVFYSAVLSASGGTAPYTFAITSGAPPAGLSLNASGTLLGTPGASGSFTFTVTATDAQGSSGSRTYTLTVNISTLDISPSGLGGASAGANYATTFTGSGGTPSYSFALANGTSLPPGLSLSPNGALTGVPSQVGSYTFAIKITDAASQVTTRAYNFDVLVNALTVTATLADGQYAKAYDTSFGTSGGSAPYTYSLASGTLPAGITLASIGELSGTPTQWGTYSFSVKATDKYGDVGTFPFTLVIGAPQISITPQTLFAATPGVFYGTLLNASGGMGTYTFSVTSGTLPPGITLAADGTLSGTANAAVGLYPFTVQAVDANGAAGTLALTLNLATPTIYVTTVGLPTGTVGAAYKFPIAATGGTAPYSFALVDGVLPGGMSLSSAGVLSGTPSTVGTWIFSALLTDANGVSVAQSFRFVIVKATRPVKSVQKKTKKKAAAKHVVKKHK